MGISDRRVVNRRNQLAGRFILRLLCLAILHTRDGGFVGDFFKRLFSGNLYTGISVDKRQRDSQFNFYIFMDRLGD